MSFRSVLSRFAPRPAIQEQQEAEQPPLLSPQTPFVRRSSLVSAAQTQQDPQASLRERQRERVQQASPLSLAASMFGLAPQRNAKNDNVKTDKNTGINAGLNSTQNAHNNSTSNTTHVPDYTGSDLFSSTGGAKKYKYKNRVYVVRTGSRGGNYILVKGKKHYI